MIFFHRRLNNYKRSKLQYMNNNFKTSLVTDLTLERHYDALRTKIDMRLTSNLISECPLNSNFSANHGDNEMIKIVKIIPTIKMRVTTQQTNTCSK